MADSAGFEPATARFVAEYSIQLSYESVMVVLDQVTTGLLKWLFKQNHFKKVADSAGFEPATARFVAEYSIQLSYESAIGSFKPDYRWLTEMALQAEPLQ